MQAALGEGREVRRGVEGEVFGSRVAASREEMPPAIRKLNTKIDEERSLSFVLVLVIARIAYSV